MPNETPEPTDAGCICKGNWRAIVRDAEPLIDQRYADENGDVWTFFGLVHASDDYYYGMTGPKGLQLLSCAGSLNSYGFERIVLEDTSEDASEDASEDPITPENPLVSRPELRAELDRALCLDVLEVRLPGKVMGELKRAAEESGVPVECLARSILEGYARQELEPEDEEN